MADQKQITPEQHQWQIKAYQAEFSFYEAYAKVLERVLKKACAVAIPEASVQVRAKSLSSFAEKCARRHDRYPDAVNQMTDLCGARVIVQTLEHVQAVREFIEANFEILERDDKGLWLSEDKFGYRDLHYIIRLRPDRHAALGITPDEQNTIGARRAEVQVRTWLQHAWADTLHDRLYKNPLQLPLAIRRTGALLAALMEEGDRNFDGMAHELDGMIANYTAMASREAVTKEIAVQELILQNEPTDEKKPGLALSLARLLEACGDYPRVVAVLEPYGAANDANRCERLQMLGYALCKMHRRDPQAADFQQGLDFLREALELCGCAERPFVPHLRKRESLHARAHARLGWALEQIPGDEALARKSKYQAHEHEPANPYYLADMLGFEIYCTRQPQLPAIMRTVIRAAIATGRDHALAGIELPGSCFTAGRLSLLLDQPFEALGNSQ
jgi:ppGpp synthetase/RelA/SpoT-type nucleotidyltranferase